MKGKMILNRGQMNELSIILNNVYRQNGIYTTWL